MQASLSVFLPVSNRQATVADSVQGLLDVLPELTPRFELLLIDDGSTDATSEVSHELAMLYPQVRLVTHAARWGSGATMRTGLLHSTGELILFRAEDCRLDLGGIAKLWSQIGCQDVVFARAAEALPGRVPRRLAVEPRSGFEPAADLALLRRCALEAWRLGADEEDWLGYLRCRGYRCQEVLVRDRAPLEDEGFRPRQPGYPARLKAFA